MARARVRSLGNLTREFQRQRQIANAQVIAAASDAQEVRRQAARVLLDPDFVIINGGIEAVEDADGVVVIGMVGGGGSGALDGGAPDRVLGGTVGSNAGLPGDR